MFYLFVNAWLFNLQQCNNVLRVELVKMSAALNHSSEKVKFCPLFVLFFCWSDKIFHKQEVRFFVFTRTDCHLTIITLIYWIKIDQELCIKEESPCNHWCANTMKIRPQPNFLIVQ